MLRRLFLSAESLSLWYPCVQSQNDMDSGDDADRRRIAAVDPRPLGICIPCATCVLVNCTVYIDHAPATTKPSTLAHIFVRSLRIQIQLRYLVDSIRYPQYFMLFCFGKSQQQQQWLQQNSSTSIREG